MYFHHPIARAIRHSASRRVIVFLLLSIMIAFPISAAAQSATTSELLVVVKGPHGSLIDTANVTLRDAGRNFERVSDGARDGVYRFSALPPSEYSIFVSANGFATASAGARLTVGQVTTLSFSLELPRFSESITVTSDPASVETQRSSSANTIGQSQIKNLPINGRNYINFALVDSKLGRDTGPFIGAAPTSGLTFTGQRPRSNLVNVDGADAVDNSVNGIRSTVSQEAVQEFQIQTNGFAAEYGRATGGVVNIVTKSGSNEFHGSVFGYLRNRNLQAINPFTAIDPATGRKDRPAYTRVQQGITFGGALKKNKTFFFFSYEGTERRESGFTSIGLDNFGLVPFDTGPLAPLLGLSGGSFGTVLLTQDQSDFFRQLSNTFNALPPAQQSALLPSLQNLTTAYLTFAGGGAGIALNGKVPSPMMIPVIAAIAARSSLPGPSGLSSFPSSGATLPPSFVTLASLRHNYPLTERTDVYSLRVDHRFNQQQSGALRIGFSPSQLSGIQNTGTGISFGQSAESRATAQHYHDWTLNAQHVWVGTSRVNEFRFQYARRGLLYTHSAAAGGSNPGVNVAGTAVFGRESSSWVNRTEQRYQVTDHFSFTHGKHTLKFGADVNFIPMVADYTTQFGGLYTFGAVTAGSMLTDTGGGPLDSLDLSFAGLGIIPIPGFSPVQSYGIGIPQSFTQAVGNPHAKAGNKAFGGFWQDAWRLRPTLTVNYGLRYDVELTPVMPAFNSMAKLAEDAMGVTEGIPRDMNNFAPRFGLAWDPTASGKTVIRASFGMFYDHPPMAMVFNSDVVDGSQAPMVVLFGGKPGCAVSNKNLLNATNAFQGLLSCLPANFNYRPEEQRFNAEPNASSIFVGQQYLAASVPLLMQPVTIPVARSYEYAYANQANLSAEHEIARNLTVSLEYNFLGGRHLARPRNTNATSAELLTLNYYRAVAAVDSLASAGVPRNVLLQLRPADPLSVAICPATLQQLGLPPVWGDANFTPAPLISFFRRSGLNTSLMATGSPFAPCVSSATSMLQEFGLGASSPVPFGDMHATFSDASSTYHGMTANFRKRSRLYELLASYTWSHSIDDGSVDLPTGVGPQDFGHPELERSNSTFDQRHRFVLTGVFQFGNHLQGRAARILNGWTFAPIIEVSSGLPFNIVTYTDRNFDFVAVSDRPRIVSAGTTVNTCGDPGLPSRFSPSGWFQLPCYKDPTPTFTGNLGRNAGTKPWTVFNDIRVSRSFQFNELMTLEVIMDLFNVANRFNTLDVNPLYSSAGNPTAASDPRQFQFALRLTW